MLLLQLICESYGPFLNLQAAMRQIPPNETRHRERALLVASHHYRTFARELHLNSKEKAESVQNPSSFRQSYQRSLSSHSAHTLEITLHLAEIFFLTPLTLALPNLFDWIEWHFALDDKEHDKFNGEERPEDTSEYWNLLFRYILRGKAKEARQLLSLHSEGGAAFVGVIKQNYYAGQADESRHSFQAFCAQLGELLQRFPVLRGSSLLVDHLAACRAWQQAISTAAAKFAVALDSHPELQRVMDILAGSDAVILERASDWKELLVARLTYKSPETKISDLNPLYQECIRAKSTPEGESDLDHLYDAAFSANVNKFVREVYETGDLWLTAHVCDLLHHRGALQARLLPVHDVSERQHAIIEFACSVATDDVNPHIFVEYILESEVPHANALVEQLLARFFPLRTERDARKLTALVQKINVDDSTRHHILERVNRITSRTFISRGLVGPAIAWTLGVNSGPASDSIGQHLSGKLLDSVIIPLSAVDIPHLLNLARVVDSLGLNVIMSNHVGLHFLRLYRDVCQGWLENEHLQVAHHLIKAVAEDLCPRRFWLPLLKDCTKLIASLSSESPSKSLFSTDQVLDAMRCLEEIYQSHERTEYIASFVAFLKQFSKDDAAVNVEVEIEEMRRILTQSLGFALMVAPPTAIQTTM